MSSEITSYKPFSMFPETTNVSDNDLFLVSKKNDTGYVSQKLTYNALKTSLGSGRDDSGSGTAILNGPGSSNLFQLGQTFALDAPSSQSKKNVYTAGSDGMFMTNYPKAAYINDTICTSFNSYDYIDGYFRYVVYAGDEIRLVKETYANQIFKLAYFSSGSNDSNNEIIQRYDYTLGDIYDWAVSNTLSQNIPSDLLTNPKIYVKRQIVDGVVLVAYMKWSGDTMLKYGVDEIVTYTIPSVYANVYSDTTKKYTKFWVYQEQKQRVYSTYHQSGITPFRYFYRATGHDTWYVKLDDIRDAVLSFVKMKKYIKQEIDSD